MKGIILVIFVLGSFPPVNAQGIKFEKDLNWEQVKAKARAENRYIFMDCYTTWCAPCKWMASNIFPQKEVGEYFNAHFINIAVQMDQTKNDPPAIQEWYTQAKTIDQELGIGSFPTYLVFSPDGKAVHRFIGTTKDGNGFINKAMDALNPERQYYTLVENYKAHIGDSLFLRNALVTALAATDKTNAVIIGDLYIDCLKTPIQKDNLALIRQVLRGSRKAFQLFLDNAARIDEVVGEKNYAEGGEGGLCNFIAKEEVGALFSKGSAQINWQEASADLKKKYPTLGDQLINWAHGKFKENVIKVEIDPIYEANAPSPDWAKISKKLARKYPGYETRQIVADEQWKYYGYKEQWPKYDQALVAYLKEYGARLGNFELNNIVWYNVFLISGNKELLSEGIKWSRKVVDGQPEDASAIDTYASLLYKAGHKEAALLWENKAMELLKKRNGKDPEISENIQKMERGERTWPEKATHP